MYDLKWIRENPDALDAALKKRGEDPRAEEILKLDKERRAVVQQLQDAQTRRNAASKEIGKAKAAGDEKQAQTLIGEVAQLKESIQQGEDAQRRLDRELRDLLATLPNAPLDDVPVGADESANELVREWGGKPTFSFQPKQHFEIGEALGLMDFETAAKLSGSRFVVLRGALARLERALASFMLDIHTQEFGYQETLPPALVRDGALFGTGQLPKFEDDLFGTQSPARSYFEVLKANRDTFAARKETIEERLQRIDESDLFATEEDHQKLQAEFKSLEETVAEYDARLPEAEERANSVPRGLWLIPTAEVPLTNLVRESIVEENDLPMRVTAWTPCFRAEAGAAGRDTRGMIRQHQFSKVELVTITTPEQSLEELERMTECAETVLQRLELPYHTVVLSTGDMGFAAQKTYDIEVWLPGQETYREISSCSVCGDFQARRMNARYRPESDSGALGRAPFGRATFGRGGETPRFVHTLNGSGLAVGRAMIAILENFQEKDGSVTIPEALRPYMGGLEKITAG